MRRRKAARNVHLKQKCPARVARTPCPPTCCRKVRSDKGKPHNHKERELRVSVVAHACAKNYLVLGSLNDIVLRNGGASMARLKLEGLHVGAPDLLILEAGGRQHGIAIELKIGNNKLSDDQKACAQVLSKKRWA